MAGNKKRKDRNMKAVRAVRRVNAVTLGAGARTADEARIRRGVVEGAEAEICPVCGMPSEGWAIPQTGGKKTWYHFGRKINCVERMGHVDSGLPRDA
jgi:hypothetical protein